VNQKCIHGPTGRLICEYGLAHRTDIYRCGAGDNEPLPASANEVKPSPEAIAKLHRQAQAISPVFTEAQGVEIQAEQACFLPIADRGRPLVGKVRGVEGVYVGSG
jgi:glycine/D-amino acid oxidase-like deaminating enzyme